MYAIARINSFDESRLAAAAERLTSFDKLHAAQPGYRGSVVVDMKDGRRLLVNLWESEQHASAGPVCRRARSGARPSADVQPLAAPRRRTGHLNGPQPPRQHDRLAGPRSWETACPCRLH